VTLEPSTYSVQWFSVDRRETKGAGKVTVEDHKSTSFTAPFAEAGPAVLYLRRVGALGAPQPSATEATGPLVSRGRRAAAS
jgi:hypothetical protein